MQKLIRNATKKMNPPAEAAIHDDPIEAFLVVRIRRPGDHQMHPFRHSLQRRVNPLIGVYMADRQHHQLIVGDPNRIAPRHTPRRR